MTGSSEARNPAGLKADVAGEHLPPYTGRHRGWTVRPSTGSARWFHDLNPDSTTRHEIWIHSIDRPAAIFGSTQVPGGHDGNHDTADPRRADSRVEVCRRRSGGGLVIARPDDVWIDAIVPRSSPLHDDDVGLAFRWLGQVWLEALRPLLSHFGLDGRELRLAEPTAGRRAADRPFFCFADVGHGEVLHRDRKVVGISQRRTRTWTRLQSLLVTGWDAQGIDKLVADALTIMGITDLNRALLGAPPHDAAGVRAGFDITGTPLDIRPERIVPAVLSCLPVVADDR